MSCPICASLHDGSAEATRTQASSNLSQLMIRIFGLVFSARRSRPAITAVACPLLLVYLPKVTPQQIYLRKEMLHEAKQ
jgi:hypothetical protein